MSNGSFSTLIPCLKAFKIRPLAFSSINNSSEDFSIDIEHYKYPGSFPEKWKGLRFSPEERRYWSQTIYKSVDCDQFWLVWEKDAELALIPEARQFVYRHPWLNEQGKPTGSYYCCWYGGWDKRRSKERFVNLLSDDEYCHPLQRLLSGGFNRFLWFLEPRLISKLKQRWKVEPQRHNNVWAIPLSNTHFETFSRSLHLLTGYRVRFKNFKPHRWTFDSTRYFDGTINIGSMWLNGEMFFIGKGKLYSNDFDARQKPQSFRVDLLDLSDGLHLFS